MLVYLSVIHLVLFLAGTIVIFRRRNYISAVLKFQLTNLSNVDISQRNISSVEWPSESFHYSVTIIIISSARLLGIKGWSYKKNVYPARIRNIN